MPENQKPFILYLDDEPQNLSVFKASFRRDYEVITVLSAPDALEQLAQHPIELIVSDQRMPGITGVEFLKKVRSNNKIVEMMILTGYSDLEVIVDAINEVGIFAYVTKPWDRNDLKLTLDNAIKSFRLKTENIRLIDNLRSANQMLEEYTHKLEWRVAERTSELQQQKNLLEQSRDKIKTINQQLTDSLNYARLIQNAVMPRIEKITEVLHDFFIFLKPRDIVSGDFYWITQASNHTIIAAVDCTGHGVPGAFMSLIGTQLLHEVVNLQNLTDPGAILSNLHNGLRKRLHSNNPDRTDGMDAGIISINNHTKEVVFSGAKMPLITIDNDQMVVYPASKRPIGGILPDDILEKPPVFENHVVNITANMMLYLFSDGYPDQFGGPKGRKFMKKKFYALLTQISKLPLTEQKQMLIDELAQWQGNYSQVDDIMVLGFKQQWV